jgi:RNA polymerase sigma factor (TIGR02999 family)
VHEAWLKLAAADREIAHERFTLAAARAMRDVIVDHVRARTAQRRGGGRAHEKGDDVGAAEPEVCTALPVEDVLTLDAALQDLQREHPDAAELVLRRFFAGQTLAEVAAERRVAVRTVERAWRFARAFLVPRRHRGARARVPRPLPSPDRRGR